MKHKSLRDVENYVEAQRLKNRWYQLTIFLAFVVVFYTVYSLILPAITLERKSCEIPEHRHTNDCYVQVASDSQAEYMGSAESQEWLWDSDENPWILICGMEEHVHTSECTPMVETSSNSNVGNVWDNLPVVGTVYAVDEPMALMAAALDGAQESEAVSSISIDPYVDTAVLYYRTDQEQPWTKVTGSKDEVIPGNAHFRLEINYKSVPIAQLLSADCQMSYQLPGLLRDAVTQGSITSGSDKVGTIFVDNGIVILQFDKDWLTDQQKTKTVIEGDFYVEAEANLSNIDMEKPGQITVGNITITINFESDLVAKYGTVDITKELLSPNVVETKDGEYLQYQLTVTAGKDGCPNVTVVDRFSNTQYIEKYVGVTGVSTSTDKVAGVEESGGVGDVYIGATAENETIPEPAGEAASMPGTLVWAVGDMKVNEVRTLTYMVKLKSEYTGATEKGNLQNIASVYSNEHYRDNDTSIFTPTAKGTLSKVFSEFIPNENGGGSITYTIWVKAEEKNTYTLENVKIVDCLDGSQDMYSTPTEIRKYLSYDADSFHLYQGGSQGQNGAEGLEEITEGRGPIFEDSDGDRIYNDRFTYYVGDLKPGECKTLVYKLNIDAGVFTTRNGDIPINNRAKIYTDDERTDGIGALNAYSAYKTLNYKTWSRKIAGEKSETSTTVTMSGPAYDATTASVTPITSPESQFTVPAGSYQYRIAANESGDWDLTSAIMTDSLGNDHMRFIGYVQVNAYQIGEQASSQAETAEGVIADLSARTPDHTIWVKVDGAKTFNFTPKDIGLEGSYAYLLTYYAIPVNVGSLSQVVVNNQFSISGTVGIGGQIYHLTGVHVNAAVTVEGGNRFQAEKSSWYYETPKVETGDFAKGALYWGIQIDGVLLPAGTSVRDITNESGGTNHYIRGGSFVGAYLAESGLDLAETYADFKAWTASGNVTSLDAERYEIAADSTSLTWTLKNDLCLDDGKSLYLIVKTEPEKIPLDKRDAYTFNNKLQSSSDRQSWVDHNVANKMLYGSENIFKELGRVFIYDGSSINDITEAGTGKGGTVITEELDGPGEYVSWAIKVNYEGNLTGRYRIVDTIPDGMEVAYARIKWRGSKTRGNSGAKVEQVTDLGDGWKEYHMSAGLDEEGAMDSFYYVSADGKTVLWEVSNLTAGHERDVYSVDFQIVCRVTDPNGSSWRR